MKVWLITLIPLFSFAEIRITKQETRVYNNGKVTVYDAQGKDIGTDMDVRIKIFKQNGITLESNISFTSCKKQFKEEK